MNIDQAFNYLENSGSPKYNNKCTIERKICYLSSHENISESNIFYITLSYLLQL